MRGVHSVQTPDGAWFHNGTDWSVVTAIRAFTIQTIIENSDATVDSHVFHLPVPTIEVDRWMEYMEQEASSLWDEANNPEETESIDLEPPEYEGYEVMTHPCIHCGTPLADTFPYALCTPCQETGSCVHGNRYKDGCSACDADSDRAYDAWRETR